ncbi:fatty-acid amide hydrolase 2-A [Schistocerca piceifrons]|uniref:fatty-acid amide hydrolase 2-A n=1 Tax=Schistocerca piceifrons TaxID=274613 RepID=UPI001F5FEDBB|nr:fatty-acid amide hydrolase 2-A [Schistocerca piceifrons]
MPRRQRTEMSEVARRLQRAAIRLVFRLLELIVSGFLQLVYHGKGEVVPPINNLLLLEPASTLALKIRTRKVSSVQVIEAYIARIKEINPILNCMVDERFSDALKEAREIDSFIASETKSTDEIARDTPFLGVPFTTKDCIQVKGLSNTAGLYKRKDIKALEDAEVIALMRKAGGIPLAVTNISELCMWWESSNTVYGRTNNPYNTNHIVGGSSGGEACIQAAAASPVGIGSDIGGSIRMPCFFNGIFGHKPSRCIVSNQGEYPVPSEEQNTFLGTGPMCRYAVDLLPTLKVIAGKNAIHLKLEEKVNYDKMKFYYMESDGGSPVVSPVHPEIKDVLLKAVSHFERAYNIKAQKIRLEKMKMSIDIWLAKMKVKNGPTFCEELANREGSITLWWELVKWFLGFSNHTFIALATALTEKLGVQPGTPEYAQLCDLCDQLHQEFQDMLGNNGVLFYPTHPTPAPYHLEPLIKPFNFAYTGIINMLGFPATHCPLGLSKGGLPIGIQVIGGMNQDHLTIAVANELEKAFGGWVPPSIAV